MSLHELRIDESSRRQRTGQRFDAGIFLLMVFLSSGLCVAAESDPQKELTGILAKLEKSPDEPMLHYRKAQCLMRLQKHDQGYDAAKAAMRCFIKAGNKLSWLLLESIDTDSVRVDVHFNMSDRERTPPKIGIIRPLTFRIWSRDEEDSTLLMMIDFEISMFEGKPMTAAFGSMKGGAHMNYGMLPPESTYTQIREKALELIKKMKLGDTTESTSDTSGDAGES